MYIYSFTPDTMGHTSFHLFCASSQTVFPTVLGMMKLYFFYLINFFWYMCDEPLISFLVSRGFHFAAVTVIPFFSSLFPAVESLNLTEASKTLSVLEAALGSSVTYEMSRLILESLGRLASPGEVNHCSIFSFSIWG